MHIYLISTLFYLIQSTNSQQCIQDEYIGLYFNSTDQFNFSPFGLSKFLSISFSVVVDCIKFKNANASLPPSMFLAMNSKQPSLDIDAIEDWMDIAERKMVTLEETAVHKEDKNKSTPIITSAQVFNFILGNWQKHLSNVSNITDSHAPLNWYNIWLLQANTDIIVDACNSSSNSIDSSITFEWGTDYSQFFPIFENEVASNREKWNDSETNLPFEIVWNNDMMNETIYYNMVVFKEECEWLECFKLANEAKSGIETYFYNDEYENISYPDSVWDYTLISEPYSPLIAYENCDVTDKMPVEAGDDNAKCYDDTCCVYEGSRHYFNIYFWYDDDVWTNSLALYQLLTQYTIEEALCDVYNEEYGDTLVPDDFYLSVSFFFNFCLLKNGHCPNYEQEKAEKKLTFFPSNIDSNNDISGYKMYATFKTRPLDLAEKIYDMLAENKKNADKFQSYVIRRAQQDFGRHNFDLFGIAISDLPQRIIFKVPQYINYGVWSFVGLCTLVAIIGALHGLYWKADCIRISGVIYFGLYTCDFYSDIVFDLELLNYDDTWLLFYACTAFIVLPWMANMLSLSRYQQKWCKDDDIRERVYSWFISWQRLIYALAAVSGSAFGTVELSNSYIFGIDFFCMGLSERHLKKFNNNRLWSCILTENLPQVIIQFWFLKLLEWEPDNSIVWLALISSSLSICAALLDIYSAKKLFAVLEPKGKAIGKVSCSFKVRSQAIKENAKKLQVSTYALRDKIAETLTTHRRSVEMHFPITTSDGFKIGFTVFSSKLSAEVIYAGLKKNCLDTDEFAKKIQKVWRLNENNPNAPLPKIEELIVEGINPEDYGHDVVEDNEERGDIEMAQMDNEKNELEDGNSNAMTLMDTLDVNPVNEGHLNPTALMDTLDVNALSEDNKEALSGHEAQMASLNAQIAMNQYLMMQQIQSISNKNELRQLMITQMQKMNGMINRSKSYDTLQFKQFSDEWQQQQSNENYEPPALPAKYDEIEVKQEELAMCDNENSQPSARNPWNDI